MAQKESKPRKKTKHSKPAQGFPGHLRNLSKWFIENPWVIIIAVFSSIFTILGGLNDIVDFIERWTSDRKILISIVVASSYLIIAIIATYLVWKPPALIKDSSHKRLPDLVRRSSASVLVVLVAVPFIFFGYIHYKDNLLEQQVVVLVANFTGSDLEDYQVTEELLFQLHAATKDYEDTVIVPLNRTINEQEGSKLARELGVKHKADLVLWGQYAVTGSDVLARIHVENLTDLPLLPEDSASGAYKKQAERAEIESFIFQDNLSGELTSFTLFFGGLIRFAAQDYANAAERMSAALEPGNWPLDLVGLELLYFFRGNAYVGLEDYELALADFSQAIDLNADHWQAYISRGIVYHYQNDYDNALADYDQAIAIDPDNETGYFNRGLIYLDTKKFQEAIEDFSDVIQIDAENDSAYANRGVAYKSLESFQLAVEDYTESIRLNPDNPLAYSNRGNAYTELKEYDNALADYAASLRIDPDVAQTYANRAYVYFLEQDYQRALEDYNIAIELGAEVDFIYTGRGNTYRALEQYQNAMDDYAKAIQISGCTICNYAPRASLATALGDYEMAISDYTALINIEPEKINYYISRAESYLSLNQYEKAITDYEAIIAMRPQYSESYVYLANVYVTMKEYHNALASYNEAISTQPVYAEAFYLRGKVHSILKNHEQAVADFSTAIELQHQNDDELFIEMIEYEGGTHVLTAGGNPPEQLTAEMFYAFKFREQLAQAYLERGKSYIQLGLVSEAKSDFDAVMEFEGNTEGKVEALKLLETIEP